MASQQNSDDQHLITYKVICSVLGSILVILLTILGFLFSNWMGNQQKTNEKILKNTDAMTADLVQVRLKITELENKMLSVETVRMISRQQIVKYMDKKSQK